MNRVREGGRRDRRGIDPGRWDLEGFDPGDHEEPPEDLESEEPAGEET